MKKALSLFLALVMCLSLWACGDGSANDPTTADNSTPTESSEPTEPAHTHVWKAATCTEPKTCKSCGQTEGALADHDWKAATCTTPKTCKACGETEGTLADHNWKAATCTQPKTCKVCGATEGDVASHNWKDATCTQPKTCKDCKTTEGSANGHSWKDATCTDPKKCNICGVTEGSAKGHSWKEATCSAPKICKICGATEGSAKGHTPNSSGKCSDCGIQLTAKDFAYLAGTDFRAIKRDYSNAEGQAAYVILFTDENGDLCVLTYIRYKIISNYSQTTLHNLSTGKTIEDPYDYYSSLANRYSGATRVRYMSLANEAYGKEILAMKGISDMLSTGSHSGVGVFVDAATLNL